MPFFRVIGPYRPPLDLGTRVDGGWTIRAIHSRGGERSYFMTNKRGVVFLCPEECMPRVLGKRGGGHPEGRTPE